MAFILSRHCAFNLRTSNDTEFSTSRNSYFLRTVESADDRNYIPVNRRHLHEFIFEVHKRERTEFITFTFGELNFRSVLIYSPSYDGNVGVQIIGHPLILRLINRIIRNSDKTKQSRLILDNQTNTSFKITYLVFKIIRSCGHLTNLLNFYRLIFSMRSRFQ